MASPPMGGSRSCQRQTCTFQPHCQRSCRAQVTLRLVPRCRVVSHRKRIFIIQALPCPFHSEGFQPTALDGGSQPFALAGPISTFGLDWGYQCPTPNRYPCFFPPKAFCIPLTRQHLPAHNRCKFPTHRTEPPSHATRKLHARAQVSPCQVFFLSHPAPRTQSGGSRFFSRSSLHVGTP